MESIDSFQRKLSLVKAFGLSIAVVGLVGSVAIANDVVINEVLASNGTAYSPNPADPFPSFPDAVELRNVTNQAVNLTGYSLSDNPSNPTKWQFPVGTMIPANGFLIVLANNEDSGLQTNFKLSSQGETLILSDSAGTEIQQLTFPRQRTDIAYGRLSDGSYAFLPNVTIGAANNETSAVLALIKRPQSDQESGIYQGSLAVSLSTEPGTTVHFTTDGSVPTTSSPVYSMPLTFTQTTVLKSIAVDGASGLTSDIASRSFIFTNVVHDLPVLIITPDEFSVIPSGGAAYDRFSFDGRIRIDFLETDGSLPISQYAEFRTSGLTSVVRPPFNGKISAKGRLGRDNLPHRFFPEKSEDRFERILVRGASQDFSQTRMRDGIVSRMISEGDIVDHEHEGFRPVAVYVQGIYSGHLNIREDDDRTFARQYFDLDEPFEKQTGSLNRLSSMYQRFASILPNPNAPDAIQRLDALVDVDETMLDLVVRDSFQAFEESVHWVSTANPTQRQRASLHDYDFCFGFPFRGNPPSLWNEVAWARASDNFPMDGQNTRFWHDAIQSCASYLMHFGYPERVNAIVDATAAEIRSEIPRTAAFYLSIKSPTASTNRERNLVVESLQEWEDFVTRVKDFVDDRMTGALPGLATTYSLNTVEVDIQTSDTARGEVSVQGYRVKPGREVGQYFANIPMRLQALPKQGYVFDQWLGDVPAGIVNDPLIELSLNATSSVTANFIPTPFTIAVSEIHYNPLTMSEADEFIELVNYGTSNIDIGGVSFTDGVTYTFPAGTILNAGARIVIRPTDYSDNLSNDGETLAISDPAGTLIESVTYNDVSPWPQAADGLGYSLVRINPADTAGASIATSWRLSSQLGGNPATSDALPITDTSSEGILTYTFGSRSPQLNIEPISMGNGSFMLEYERVVNADAVDVVLTSSTDLLGPWVTEDTIILRPEGVPENTLQTFMTTPILNDEVRKFFRLEITSR